MNTPNESPKQSEETEIIITHKTIQLSHVLMRLHRTNLSNLYSLLTREPSQPTSNNLPSEASPNKRIASDLDEIDNVNKTKELPTPDTDSTHLTQNKKPKERVFYQFEETKIQSYPNHQPLRASILCPPLVVEKANIIELVIEKPLIENPVNFIQSFSQLPYSTPLRK